tara:strand:- start:1378 stop:1944 length:567 start_codon:yes stop_codon:yes gene_type:complete
MSLVKRVLATAFNKSFINSLLCKNGCEFEIDQSRIVTVTYSLVESPKGISVTLRNLKFKDHPRTYWPNNFVEGTSRREIESKIFNSGTTLPDESLSELRNTVLRSAPEADAQHHISLMRSLGYSGFNEESFWNFDSFNSVLNNVHLVDSATLKCNTLSIKYKGTVYEYDIIWGPLSFVERIRVCPLAG